MAKHILVVEDEPDLRTTLEFNLKSEGYKVKSAADGEAAITEIGKKVPDVVLLDLMLPDMSGLEVCKKIRNESFSNQVSIITVSYTHLTLPTTPYV